jgi:c-di-GMP-binding flagellar brake protein YcgR
MGDRVEITQLSIRHGERTYNSKVEAILGTDVALIYAPMEKGRALRLSDKDGYSLLFISERGVFRFRAKISSYVEVDKFQVIRFLLTDKGERSQRREFFRFNCSIGTKFSLINKEDGEESSKEMEDGIIRDLGGGGMKLMSAYNMKENIVIRLMLQLDEAHIMILGEVVHKKQNAKAMLPYQYGVKFMALSKADQEKIIQYLYNEQRKSLINKS